MIGGKRIFKNTVFLMLSSVVSLGISLVTTSLIARSIGPELYGKYTFGLSYILLFSVLANFGLESLFIREAARDRKNISEMIFDILHLKVVLALFAIGAIIVSINIFHYPKSTINIVYILCIGLFFQILSNSVLAVYRSLERMGIIACFGLGFRVISAIIVIASIYFKVGLVGIVSAFSIGNAAVFFVSIMLFYKEFKLMRLKVSLRKWVELARRGMPFYISALLTMVYFKINVVMLSKMRGELEVGFYMAAATLVESLLFISEAFNTSVFPAFSRIHGSATDALELAYKKAIKYLILVTTAICTGTLLVGKQIILLIYGKEFLSSANALMILIFFWAFLFISTTMSTLLFSIRKEVTQMKIMVFACLINISLNIILIKEYGYIGCALSSTISEAFVIGMIGLVLWRTNLRFRLDWHFSRHLLSLGSMILIVLLLRGVNVLMGIAGGAVSYVFLLFLLKVFDSEEVKIMKSLVTRETLEGNL